MAKSSGAGLPNHPLFQGDPHLATLRGQEGFDRLMEDVERQHAAIRAEFVSG